MDPTQPPVPVYQHPAFLHPFVDEVDAGFEQRQQVLVFGVEHWQPLVDEILTTPLNEERGPWRTERSQVGP